MRLSIIYLFLLYVGCFLCQNQKVGAFSSPAWMVASPASNRPKRSKKKCTTLKNSNKKKCTPPKTTKQKKRQQLPPPSAPRSIGEAVQQARSPEDLLQTAAQLWLPTDTDLKPHLRTQHIHHEKRQRWSAQLLAKLGDLVVLEEKSQSTETLWKDDRFARAVQAAAMPFQSKENEQDNIQIVSGNEKECRAVREALIGIHTLAGMSLPFLLDHEKDVGDKVHPEVLSGVQLLIARAEAMADDISLQEVIELRWAVRGLLAIL